MTVKTALKLKKAIATTVIFGILLIFALTSCKTGSSGCGCSGQVGNGCTCGFSCNCSKQFIKMTIPMLLTFTAQLESDLTEEELNYKFKEEGICWDIEKELVKKIYEILEDYRKENY